jgi:hypothetical protein
VPTLRVNLLAVEMGLVESAPALLSQPSRPPPFPRISALGSSVNRGNGSPLALGATSLTLFVQLRGYSYGLV